MHSPHLSRLWPIMLFLLTFGGPAPAGAQTTYRDIGLDCGGWFSGFAQHPSGRLYGYGDIFGVYRSDDFGGNWRFLQNSFTEWATFVVGLGCSRVDADRVAFSTYNGLWTSIDGGETWTKRLGDLSNIKHTRGSFPVVYHPTAASELWFAGTRSGLTGTLWRSTNDGASWTSVGGTTFAGERAVTIHFFPAAPSEVWVGTVGGLWCSTNAGSTWRKVWNNNGNQTPYFGTPQVNSIARNANRVSLLATNAGVWRVTASNWADTSTYVSTVTLWQEGHNIPNVTALADGSFYAAEMGDQSFAPRISANGVNWTERPATLTAAYVPVWTTASRIVGARVYGRDQLVQDVNNPARWLMTGGAAPHLSEDSGSTWRYSPRGLAGMATFRVQFDRTHPGRAYIAAADHGAFVVTDGGVSGNAAYCSNSSIGGLKLFHQVMSSADGQTLVGAGTDQGSNQSYLLRSTDGGVSWATRSGSGLPASHDGITRAVMSLTTPNDYLVLLANTERSDQSNSPNIYRTTNGGSSFVKATGIPDGLDTGNRYHPENSSLERDGINAQVRYASFRGRYNPSAKGLWRSNDGGTSWTLRSDPFPGPGWIWALAVDPTSEGRLWVVGDSPGVRTSADGGATWTTLPGFIEARYVDAYAGRIAVLGRRTGDTLRKIYYSPDQGSTWQDMANPQNRLIWAQSVSVDPWRPGQLWITGSRSVTVVMTGPEPKVSGAGVAIVSGDTSPQTADGTAFGSAFPDAAPGASGVERTFTLTNSGAAPLLPGAITFTGSAATDYTVVTPPASSVPSGGSTTFTVRFRPSALNLRPATLRLASNALTSPYTFALSGTGVFTAAAWSAAHFTPAEITAGFITGNLADPDGDGLSNLLEYALGGLPRLADPGLSPQPDKNAEGQLTLTFRRLRDATDITYIVSGCSDLVNWEPIWSSATVPYPGVAAQTEVTVTDTVPLAPEGRRFLRLSITQP